MRSIDCVRALTISAVAMLLAVSAVGAQTGTLILPFRTVGVSDTTAFVTRDLLAVELEQRGLPVLGRVAHAALPAGLEGCDEIECARRLAQERAADQVVFGSLSRLGEKVIVRVRALRASETAPFFTDQLTAVTEEDLDTVMRRLALGIASGRPDSERATVESITREESEEPRRRSGRSGLGLRAGFIFPAGESYGEERLTSLRVVYKFENPRFMIETTALAGLAWGDGSFEWMPLDLFVARIFGVGDVSAYAGGGLGLRYVNVEREVECPGCYPGLYCECIDSQGATALSADVGCGVIVFRTYGFQIVTDLRYHYVFDEFEEIGGHGAHGWALSFGTSH